MINRRAAGLIDENPLMVYRSLAKEIGLNEAMILQQVHFWSRDSNNVRDGYSWVYNTYADWEKQFDFWSTATIRRSINRLEEAGLLISTSEYNKMKIDNTKWYRIDYEALENRLSRPPAQIEQTECSDCTDTPDQIEQANNQREPERTTESITTLTPKREKRTYSEDDQYYQMAEYLHNAIMRTAEANGKKHLVEKADMKKWADDFRKMVELDGRSNLQELKTVIEFATTDSFWQTNILSAKKLREKYATLAMKAGQKPKKTNNLAERGDDQRSRLKNKILGGATVDRNASRVNLLEN